MEGYILLVKIQYPKGGCTLTLCSIPISVSLTRGFLKMKGSHVVHGYLYVYLPHNKNLTTDLQKHFSRLQISMDVQVRMLGLDKHFEWSLGSPC